MYDKDICMSPRSPFGHHQTSQASASVSPLATQAYRLPSPLPAPPFIPPHALLCRWWLILAVAILVVLILLLCCIWCCCDGECGSGRPSKEDRVSVHSTPEKASPPRGAVQGTPLRADGEGKVVRLKGGSPPLRSGAQPLLDASEGTTVVHARSAYLPLMYLATRLFLMCSGCPELEVGWGRVGELI